MDVAFLDLNRLHQPLEPQLRSAAARVLDRNWYIRGQEVAAFEASFAAAVGARHCVATGNGLDALHLALLARGVKPGDRVLVPSHTYIATWLAVTMLGAEPVPVESSAGSYNLDLDHALECVDDRTVAIVPVHLYGEPVDTQALDTFADRTGLVVVEDAAQAHGAASHGQRVGAAGTAAWSFYPGKNLGALGDAGAVTTDDADLADRVRRLGNYGSSQRYVHEVKGVNSRMDELQAAFLSAKLPHLEGWNSRRREIADAYLRGLASCDLTLPATSPHAIAAWHLFVVRVENRDRVAAQLHEHGVATQIHYPTACHQQGAYQEYAKKHLPVAEKYAREVLSLPMDPTMSDSEIEIVIARVRQVLDGA